MITRIAAALIRSVAALADPFLTYKQFAHEFGFSESFPLSWANKNTLDKVADLLKANPEVGIDLTFLIRNQETGYPSQIDGEPYRPGNRQQEARAREVAGQIIAKYKLRAKNPY